MKKAANNKPRLLALNGEAKPEPVFLNLDEGESFTFGRNAVFDLLVKDIAVSRRHCQTQTREIFCPTVFPKERWR